jgi:hypothetical protein
MSQTDDSVKSDKIKALALAKEQETIILKINIAFLPGWTRKNLLNNIKSNN